MEGGLQMTDYRSQIADGGNRTHPMVGGRRESWGRWNRGIPCR